MNEQVNGQDVEATNEELQQQADKRKMAISPIINEARSAICSVIDIKNRYTYVALEHLLIQLVIDSYNAGYREGGKCNENSNNQQS